MWLCRYLFDMMGIHYCWLRGRIGMYLLVASIISHRSSTWNVMIMTVTICITSLQLDRNIFSISHHASLCKESQSLVPLTPITCLAANLISPTEWHCEVSNNSSSYTNPCEHFLLVQVQNHHLPRARLPASLNILCKKRPYADSNLLT